jgi:hypothetical protein
MQYLDVCSRKCKSGVLNAQTLKHHADSYSAIKKKTKDAKVTPMKKTGDVLAWLDDVNKTLKTIIGNRGVPLMHSKKIPVAWYCRLRNEYPPFLQEHYRYYLASDCMLQLYQVLFCVKKKGNPALFRLKKLRV